MRRLLPVLVLAAACSSPAKPAANTSAHFEQGTKVLGLDR